MRPGRTRVGPGESKASVGADVNNQTGMKKQKAQIVFGWARCDWGGTGNPETGMTSQQGWSHGDAGSQGQRALYEEDVQRGGGGGHPRGS